MTPITKTITKTVTKTEVDHEATGRKLAALRIAKGISQAELARRMDISAMYLCDLEKGRRSWNQELIAKFERAVNGLVGEH